MSTTKSLSFFASKTIVNNFENYNKLSKFMAEIIIKNIFSYDNAMFVKEESRAWRISEDRGRYAPDTPKTNMLDNPKFQYFMKYCLSKFADIKLPKLHRMFGDTKYINNIGESIYLRLIESRSSFVIVDNFCGFRLKTLDNDIDEYQLFFFQAYVCEFTDTVNYCSHGFNVNDAEKIEIFLEKKPIDQPNVLLQIDDLYYLITFEFSPYFGDGDEDSTEPITVKEITHDQFYNKKQNRWSKKKGYMVKEEKYSSLFEINIK